MKLKSALVVPIVLCGPLLSSCFLVYPKIPPIEFRVEDDNSDLELTVLSMSRGSHQKREDGVIVASNNSTTGDITFMLRSGTQGNQFVARTGGDTGIKGAGSGVVTTYGFGGGMWLASGSSRHYGQYGISGVPASPGSFVVGRVVRDKNEAFVPLVDTLAPHTEIQFDPLRPGIVLTGRGGASVLAQGSFCTQGRSLDIYAPLGSSVVVEQGDGRQELEVGSSLPLRVEMLPGRAEIRWFPTGSVENHAEMIIDDVTDAFGHRNLSFSSMLDAPMVPIERVSHRGSRR